MRNNNKYKNIYIYVLISINTYKSFTVNDSGGNSYTRNRNRFLILKGHLKVNSLFGMVNHMFFNQFVLIIGRAGFSKSTFCTTSRHPPFWSLKQFRPQQTQALHNPMNSGWTEFYEFWETAFITIKVFLFSQVLTKRYFIKNIYKCHLACFCKNLIQI